MSEIVNTSVIELDDIDDAAFSEMIESTITDFDDGDLVEGTVVNIERDEVLVDIGFKSEGVIPLRELSIRKDAGSADIVTLGDKIEALVLLKEDKDGRLILSKRRAEYERAWIDVEQKFNAAESVVGEVIEVVKGGLIVDIGLRGFLPASLVDLRRVKDLESFTGEQIEARVIEMDRNRNNVVLSRRVVLEEGRKNERSEILEKLTKGMRLKGTVSSIVDFGTFVDLGGIDGLVHISELSWNHVNHPSEVVKVGDEVDVEVLDVDLSRERISLGLKQTTEDPWRALVKNYPISSLLEGRVTKLVTFGAFVELGANIEGLVHISEMAQRHVVAPAQVVKVGDIVQVKVIDIDPGRRRVSLSMKQAAEDLGLEITVAEIEPSMIKTGKGKKKGHQTGEAATKKDEGGKGGRAKHETQEAARGAEAEGVDKSATATLDREPAEKATAQEAQASQGFVDRDEAAVADAGRGSRSRPMLAEDAKGQGEATLPAHEEAVSATDKAETAAHSDGALDQSAESTDTTDPHVDTASPAPSAAQDVQATVANQQ